MKRGGRQMRVGTSRYDLGGCGILRTASVALVRFMVPVRPMDMGGGAGAKWLVKLLVCHYFGRLLCGARISALRLRLRAAELREKLGM